MRPPELAASFCYGNLSARAPSGHNRDDRLFVRDMQRAPRPHVLDEAKEFFVSYHKQRDRKFEATHHARPRKARKPIKGNERFKKKRRKGA